MKNQPGTMKNHGRWAKWSFFVSNKQNLPIIYRLWLIWLLSWTIMIMPLWLGPSDLLWFYKYIVLAASSKWSKVIVEIYPLTISTTYLHPGSFHYPHLANLPTIATFAFVKVIFFLSIVGWVWEICSSQHPWSFGGVALSFLVQSFVRLSVLLW